MAHDDSPSSRGRSPRAAHAARRGVQRRGHDVAVSRSLPPSKPPPSARQALRRADKQSLRLAAVALSGEAFLLQECVAQTHPRQGVARAHVKEGRRQVAESAFHARDARRARRSVSRALPHPVPNGDPCIAVRDSGSPPAEIQPAEAARNRSPCLPAGCPTAGGGRAPKRALPVQGELLLISHQGAVPGQSGAAPQARQRPKRVSAPSASSTSHHPRDRW